MSEEKMLKSINRIKNAVKGSGSPRELTMYFLVRSDLRMSKGKVGAQVGHAVQDLIHRCPRPIMDQYRRENSPKICLRVADLEDLEEVASQCRDEHFAHHLVIDMGLTQVAPNTPTVLGIGPVSREKIRPIVGNFKLL